jgi:uncharacterized membrane protein (DUF2068 family)
LTPEARARQSIDALLDAAGWAVWGLMQARIVAEVDRHLPIIREVEVEVDTSLLCMQALRLAKLGNVLSLPKCTR